jgi:hypothetical protein
LRIKFVYFSLDDGRSRYVVVNKSYYISFYNAKQTVCTTILAYKSHLVIHLTASYSCSKPFGSRHRLHQASSMWSGRRKSELVSGHEMILFQASFATSRTGHDTRASTRVQTGKSEFFAHSHSISMAQAGRQKVAL